MNIKVLSDIHTEFWQSDKDYVNPGSGQVLVLAGDIGISCDLSDPDSYYRQFLNDCSLGYDQVYYVMGNHESYNGDFTKTEEIIRSHLPNNVTLLQNQSQCYEDVHFVGATLWTDFNNASTLR